VNDCIGICKGEGGQSECVCGGSGRAVDAAEYLQRRLLRAEEALDFYADPDTYFACAFLFDPPCGAFHEDFSRVEGDTTDRPGKRAREALYTPLPVPE
jgi:hypothetical protein